MAEVKVKRQPWKVGVNSPVHALAIGKKSAPTQDTSAGQVEGSEVGATMKNNQPKTQASVASKGILYDTIPGFVPASRA